ncbi:MAG: hypothetical protein ACI93T_004286, partial [Porticoccaceae bacterium]
MLLSSWLKRISDRIRSRRYQPDRKPKKPDRFTQLGLTRLEDRVVLTASAVFSGFNDLLVVDVDQEDVTISTNGGRITVTGSVTGALGAFTAVNVQQIIVNDTNAGVGSGAVDFTTSNGSDFVLFKGVFVSADIETAVINTGITATSNGNTVDINAGTLQLNADVIANAGSILLAGDVVLGEGQNVTLSTGATTGQIQIDGSLNGTGGGASEALVITAGTGDVVLNNVGMAGADDLESLTVTSADDVQIAGTVDLGSALSVTANSVTLGDDVATGSTIDVVAGNGAITVKGALDTTTAGSDITLTATSGLLLDGANADVASGGGSFTVDADSNGDNTGSYEQNDAGSTVSAGAGSVSITAANATITGSISGTGALTFLPSTVARSIGLGGGAGNFNLSDAELLQLSDGFTGITIGRADGTGAIVTDTANFTDPITLRGGAATLGGLTTSQDNAATTVTTATTTGVTVTGTLSANGSGAVDINSGAGFLLSNGITLSSSTGAISVDTTGANSLTVNGNVTTAGSGTVMLTGSGAVTMDDSSLIQADSTITVTAGAGDATIDVVTSTASTVT